MRTTKVVDNDGCKCRQINGSKFVPIAEFHRDFVSGENRDKDEELAAAQDADLLFYRNWHILSEAEKIECGAQVWEYSAYLKKWCPLTQLYTG